MSNSFYVYGLFDPDEGFPFYIGKGSKGPYETALFRNEKGRKQISEMYGVSISTVSYIKNNKRWTHVNSKSPEQ